MKTFSAILFSLSLLLFASCIKDEALNAECDITGVDTVWLAENRDILDGEPVIDNNHVDIPLQRGTDRGALSPRFYLTPGARLTMLRDGQMVEANGAARDFTRPQTYTAVSEDGAWKKDYVVKFFYRKPIRDMHFEHFASDASGRYDTWHEINAEDPDNHLSYWATGNAGYAMTGMAKTPADYPSAVLPSGYRGNGVRLTTRSTGSFGQLAGLPIAAGNLFIGEFRSQQAMLFPRKATRFGLRLVGGRPLRLEGYYRYRAGEVFTDKQLKPRPELHDSCDIYSVLYEVDGDNFVPLDGDNVLSSERIVMMARLEQAGEPADWTHFSVPFREVNGKEFSEERLSANGYAIAIVATSSREGAFFEGAVGSVLDIDEFRIVWEGDE